MTFVHHTIKYVKISIHISEPKKAIGKYFLDFSDRVSGRVKYKGNNIGNNSMYVSLFPIVAGQAILNTLRGFSSTSLTYNKID